MVNLNFYLPEFSQIIFSPGPLIYKLRSLLKNFTQDDYLLLTGDPAIIGVACSIVSDMTNGKYNLLKWDKQERQYYPIKINLYEKGEIMSDLQKMFIEDAPQQVNELNNPETLSSHVLELQKLEDEIKMDEERLSQKKNKQINFHNK